MPSVSKQQIENPKPQVEHQEDVEEDTCPYGLCKGKQHVEVEGVESRYEDNPFPPSFRCLCHPKGGGELTFVESRRRAEAKKRVLRYM